MCPAAPASASDFARGQVLRASLFAMTLTRRSLLMVGAASGLAACSAYPMDPDKTLDRVRERGKLRVGVSPSAPWTTVGDREGAVATVDGQPIGGVEVALAQQFARSLGVEPLWQVEGEQRLVEKVEMDEVDLAIGGFTADSPWSAQVGLTRAYAEAPNARGKKVGHVMLVPPGENALVSQLERFLDSRPAAEKGPR